ncbi:MAG: histidine phosphatase family protein [Candidatus Hodarchaeales archaeon]|jgi:broad specificity phosphatase PhoE
MTVTALARAKESTYRIFLVRHGQSKIHGQAWKEKKLPLSKLGMKQAQLTRKALEREPINAIFTSPMKRALQTAEIIASPHDLNVHIIDKLCEIDTGSFSGKTNTEVIKHGENFKDIITKARDGPLVAQLLDHYPGLAFPQGESVGQMVQRVVEGWDSLLETIEIKNYPVTAVVSHGGTQTVILRHLSSYILSKDLNKQKFENASITEIEMLDGRRFQVKRVNDISHLKNGQFSF